MGSGQSVPPLIGSDGLGVLLWSGSVDDYAMPLRVRDCLLPWRTLRGTFFRTCIAEIRWNSGSHLRQTCRTWLRGIQKQRVQREKGARFGSRIGATHRKS